MKKWAQFVVAGSAAVLISIAAACIAPREPGAPEPEPVNGEMALAVLRGAGGELLATVGTDYLRKKAPRAVAVIDADKDGRVTIEECEALVTAATPEELGQRLVWLGLMAGAVLAAKGE